MDTRKRAKPNTPERYLWPKPGARYLWFRMAVPVRYQTAEGRKIIQCCLGTNDRREASLRAARLRSEWHERWRGKGNTAPLVADRCAIPTVEQLQAAATLTCYLNIGPKLHRYWQDIRAGSPTAHDDLLACLGSVRRKYVTTWETDTLPKWQAIADAHITRNGWHLPKGSSDYDAFVQMVAEAAIECLRIEIERRSGEFGVEPSSTVVKAGLEQLQASAPPRETIAELFERYAKQRLAEKRKRPDTIVQDRKVVLQFAAFVGVNRSIRSLMQSDIREWRDAIASLPPKHRAAKAYKGLSLKEAAQQARSSGAAPMSPTTVNKYLSTVSPFLAWCVRNDYAERNPCDGLFYDLPKGRNPRPPFSAEQLEQIFRSPLFTGFEADGREHRPGTQRADDWRYWIPLVCLFTGARITEIAQLRIHDLQDEDGTPFLHLRHDERTGQMTKSGRSRIVPIHSKLMEIGFVRFVRRQAERAGRSDASLFPELSPNDRGLIGAEPSRFWRDYMKRIRLKQGGDGFGSHSFRHTMADELRRAGFLDEEVALVLGHSRKTVTSGYGRLPQGTVSRISRVIEQVRYPCVDHLID